MINKIANVTHIDYGWFNSDSIMCTLKNNIAVYGYIDHWLSRKIDKNNLTLLFK